jgi:hypothetical protein
MSISLYTLNNVPPYSMFILGHRRKIVDKRADAHQPKEFRLEHNGIHRNDSVKR